MSRLIRLYQKFSVWGKRTRCQSPVVYKWLMGCVVLLALSGVVFILSMKSASVQTFIGNKPSTIPLYEKSMIVQDDWLYVGKVAVGDAELFGFLPEFLAPSSLSDTEKKHVKHHDFHTFEFLEHRFSVVTWNCHHPAFDKEDIVREYLKHEFDYKEEVLSSLILMPYSTELGVAYIISDEVIVFPEQLTSVISKSLPEMLAQGWRPTKQFEMF